MNNNSKGKLIVIDGTDGSGKATQVKLLLEYLKNQGYKTRYIDFPRYYSSFHGKMVARYLSGEFGQEVNPYLASLTYALDRLTARDQMKEWLDAGEIIVANRYTSSSMAYQTAKLPHKERAHFLKWLVKMEYDVHKLPKENVVLFLHVPIEVGLKLVEKRGAQKYLKGKTKDIHEEKVAYQKEAEKMYLELCLKYKHWKKIECLGKSGRLLSTKTIHKMVIDSLEKGVLVNVCKDI